MDTNSSGAWLNLLVHVVTGSLVHFSRTYFKSSDLWRVCCCHLWEFCLWSWTQCLILNCVIECSLKVAYLTCVKFISFLINLIHINIILIKIGQYQVAKFILTRGSSLFSRCLSRFKLFKFRNWFIALMVHSNMILIGI